MMIFCSECDKNIFDGKGAKMFFLNSIILQKVLFISSKK
jgi:hypothetical protein